MKDSCEIFTSKTKATNAARAHFQSITGLKRPRLSEYTGQYTTGSVSCCCGETRAITFCLNKATEMYVAGICNACGK